MMLIILMMIIIGCASFNIHNNLNRILKKERANSRFTSSSCNNLFMTSSVLGPSSHGNSPQVQDKRGVFTGSGSSMIDVYACHPDSQGLVMSQISNFITSQKDDLDLAAYHSVVFGSVDGKRVVHYTGMLDMPIEYATSIYEEYKARCDDRDGTPAALKESTHLYKTHYSSPKNSLIDFSFDTKDKYSLYTIDIWTNRMPEYTSEVLDSLIQGVDNLKVPELVSSHVMSSTDDLSCCVFGMWQSLYEFESCEKNIEYQQSLSLAKKYAVSGTLSDVIDKSKKHIYYVYDIQIKK